MSSLSDLSLRWGGRAGYGNAEGVSRRAARRLRVTDSRFRKDMYPVDTSCDCYTCKNFSRAYLHHLFRVGEILSATLATLHNIRFFMRFMEQMRASILDGTFAAFRKRAHEIYPEETGPRPVASYGRHSEVNTD